MSKAHGFGIAGFMEESQDKWGKGEVKLCRRETKYFRLSLCT